jgi:hypothetical protein
MYLVVTCDVCRVDDERKSKPPAMAAPSWAHCKSLIYGIGPVLLVVYLMGAPKQQGH